MKTLTTSLLLWAFLVPLVHAADEVRYYDIEVIIFESLDPTAKASEIWKHEVSMTVPPLAVELGQPYPGPIPKEFNPKLSFKVLPDNQLQLQDEDKLLTASNNYRILLHTAWRQPGMDAETALPVHINLSFIDSNTPSSTTPNATTPLAMQSPALASSDMTQTRSTLNGYIKIILSRYLHADINLVYTTGIPLSSSTPAPLPLSDDAEIKPLTPPQPTVYVLSQTRKMRSKELHYIDHPVLGVLILATPYEEKRR